MTDFKIGDAVACGGRLHKIVRMSAVVLEDPDGNERIVQIDSCIKVSENGAASFAKSRRAYMQKQIDALIAQRDELK